VVFVTGPLNGVRIVMMGGLGPAPFCGMLLGDLGADVIRVDPFSGVEGPPPIDYAVRRGQRSLAADVKDPRAMVDGVATLLAPYFGMVRAGTWCDRREDTPVLSLSEAPRHPHLVARETFIDVDAITALEDAGVVAQSSPH
jgi:crotonobetainyl-CoA:carnitine CoA-transferase CaiB-like acyl-CoA transferase